MSPGGQAFTLQTAATWLTGILSTSTSIDGVNERQDDEAGDDEYHESYTYNYGVFLPDGQGNYICTTKMYGGGTLEYEWQAAAESYSAIRGAGTFLLNVMLKEEIRISEVGGQVM